MIHIKNLQEGLPIFKSLDSEIRLEILNLLYKNYEMKMDDIAKAVNLSNGAVTAHMRKLVDCGLVNIKLVTGKRGSQKMCRLNEDKILIDLIPEKQKELSHDIELDAGQYSNYLVHPTCGLSTIESMIGDIDDPKYFSYPERFKANILWFARGFVEYKIPNLLRANEEPIELQISLEISSEAPGSVEHYPSDIHFTINDKLLGYWTSPGEFFDRTGHITPRWWFQNFGQYGRLKMLVLNKEGTFLDGIMLSDVTIDDLDITHKSEISLQLSVPDDAENIGGLTIFGKGFGDYNIGIKTKIIYKTTLWDSN